MMGHFRTPRSRRQGATMVEMALILPVLILLLFGTLEFGLLIKDYLGLNQAAREGVRAAAVGAMAATIESRVQEQAPTLDAAQLTWSSGWSESVPGIYGRFRQYDNSTGLLLAPQPLGDDASKACNTARNRDQVEVMVTYEHKLVTGNVLAWLADSDKPGVVTIRSRMVMRRE